MPKFKYIAKLPFYIFDVFLIRYVCNPSVRGIQIILFGYIFRLEWRRDIFREMFAERSEQRWHRYLLSLEQGVDA